MQHERRFRAHAGMREGELARHPSPGLLGARHAFRLPPPGRRREAGSAISSRKPLSLSATRAYTRVRTETPLAPRCA
jgi:hypothetical protein